MRERDRSEKKMLPELSAAGPSVKRKPPAARRMAEPSAIGEALLRDALSDVVPPHALSANAEKMAVEN